MQSNGHSIKVSRDETQNPFHAEQFVCSPDITAGIHGQLTFISVLNSFLSIAAFLGNALILVVLRKESSLHPPSKHLLRTLTTTDLCVGLFVEHLNVTLIMVVMNEHWNICRYAVVAVSGYCKPYLERRALADTCSHPPTSSKSSGRPYSTTESNKSTEHSAIQKGSVHCTVVAIHVSRLLSTIFNIGNFGHSC